MQRVGLAAFLSGGGLFPTVPSLVHIETPLHLRASTLTPRFARRFREHPMAGYFTSIYCCEESLRVRAICATYRACAAEARWGRNDRSVAQITEYFPGGAPAIRTCPRRHWRVC